MRIALGERLQAALGAGYTPGRELGGGGASRRVSVGLAWLAAARGHRQAADRVLSAAAAHLGAEVRAQPGGEADAVVTCARAEVAGLLGDVAAMLVPLRRCMTMANGYPVAWIRRPGAFTRHAQDPRVLALAAELEVGEFRARRKGVPTDR